MLKKKPLARRAASTSFRRELRQLVVFTFFLILSTRLQASPPASITSSDNPLKVDAILPGGKLLRYIRLTNEGASAVELNILRGDLKSSDGALILNRGDIEVSSPITLAPGETKDVSIAFNNIASQGDYFGQLQLVPKGSKLSDGIAVALELHIYQKPSVTFVPSNLSYKAIECNLFCRAADWMLPGDLSGNQRSFVLNSQMASDSKAKIKIIQPEIVLTGQKTGRILTLQDVQATWPDQLSAGANKISFTLKRADLPPDRYSGQVRVGVNHEKPLAPPDFISAQCSLDVRTGPLLPLLVVLIGIVIGRLVSASEEPLVQTQQKLLNRVYALQGAARELKDNVASTELEIRLRDIVRRIELLTDGQEAEISRRLEAIGQSVLLLRQLDDYRELCEGLPPDKADPIKAKIDEARNIILGGELAKGEGLCKEIENAIHAAGRKVVEKFNVLSDLDQVPTPISQGLFEKTLSELAGIYPIRATVWHRYIRPLMFVLLLVLLTAIGFYTFYIQKGSTFGSDSLFDYLSLLFWGLSADVARSKLQSLSIPK